KSFAERQGIPRQYRLGDIAQLAADVERLRDLNARIQALPWLNLLGDVGTEVTHLAGVRATLRFAKVLGDSVHSCTDILTVSPFHDTAGAILETVSGVRANLANLMELELAARERVAGLAGSLTGDRNTPIDQMIQRLDRSMTHADSVEEWSQLLLRRDEVAKERGLPILESVGEARPVALAELYEAALWWSLARRVFDVHPELKGMTGSSQNTARRRLRDTENRILELNRREIAAKLCRVPIPEGSDRGPRSEWTGAALVRRQSELQRPRIAIR